MTPQPVPGRDPRAQLHEPRPPEGTAPARQPRVAVVGGGIAGVAAATALVERDVAVTLLERDPQLGGRLSGWQTTLADGTTATMSRGFHAFFRQYYNLRALMRRIDPALAMLTPLPDYPLVHASGARDGFTGLPATPPWNAFAFVAGSPSFRWRDLADVNIVAALSLLDVAVPDVYRRFDHVDALDFLDRLHFPASARHLALEVFSRSFFADPRSMSAAELLTMFHIYFLGSSEGLIFDVPNAPFPQALWNPLARRLRFLGADVRTSCPVEEISGGQDRRYAVRTPDETAEYDAVVVATDVSGLRGLVASSPALADRQWREHALNRPGAPPFLVSRLWLDRPVRSERPGFLGTSGYPTLDNISVLERYEGEAADWARATGGSVVELHAYALPEHLDPVTEQKRLIGQLHRVYPETADGRIIDERHELRADCPLFPPGGFTDRPAITTPDPFLVLAGDHVRVDLPVALMERAATSGFLAANALLRRWGRHGHPVWTVPNRGRLPWARRPAGQWSGSFAQAGQRPDERKV
ncbi:NAD(P)/FAD-dependent oxidoreductase [Nocardiopsis ansamitocini]|uniref:Isorenieratene synthase n=1 Tax=Nocardiopsis ansamitocini TaxID=1670832 RepID=A0A9W6P4J6_9ACTN|nr:NAD(P)/FAD-dependent oxidoreductase [Nocardiopsis ansamitocini]GLU46977.1 isorenieratene synthase [Nocardiopsis ansamitocini]